MQKQSMWSSAVLGALWLALAGLPATAQEGRPAGSDRGRGQAAPPAQPQRGEPRPAEERPKDGERAQPADRPGAERGPTDRAPQGQPGRGTPSDRPADRPTAERGQGQPQTDAARGLGPADRLAQVEMKHATMTARIERLMEVYREKDDKAKLLELEQLRERAKNKHQKDMAELERELGPERFRAARAAFAGRQGGVPSERCAEMRSDRAPEGQPREIDEAERAEQARKEAARKKQAGNETDRAKDKPARPADKPAEKPERERDGGGA